MSDLIKFLSRDSDKAVMKRYNKPAVPPVTNDRLVPISKDLAFVGQKVYKLTIGDKHIPKGRKYQVFLIWTLIKVVVRMAWGLR